MLERLSITDEIWNKPVWVGVFSVVLSLVLYVVYAKLAGLEQFESGLLPAILIPAIVAPTCSILIRRYVNRIKRQNQKLAELNATNRKLLSIITHDVRGPMASIKGLMELYFSGNLSRTEFDRFGEDLLQQVEHVLDLQDAILTWAKRQEGLSQVSLVHFDLGEVIKTTVDLYDQQRKDKGLALDMASLNNTVYSDRDVFSFVFRNIYQNAIKFTPQGGAISVRSSIVGDTCELRVEDTGIGIEQEEIDMIMNPNQYFTKKGTNNEKGTGFGLNASIHYLKECNGSLSVKSLVGEGSCFTISLPVKPLKKSRAA